MDVVHFVSRVFAFLLHPWNMYVFFNYLCCILLERSKWTVIMWHILFVCDDHDLDGKSTMKIIHLG